MRLSTTEIKERFKEHLGDDWEEYAPDGDVLEARRHNGMVKLSNEKWSTFYYRGFALSYNPDPEFDTWLEVSGAGFGGRTAKEVKTQIDRHLFKPLPEIEVGDEVLVITYTDPTPSGRRTVVGVGRAQMVERDGDKYKVRMLVGSLIVPGIMKSFPRKELYHTKSKREVAYFDRLIEFYFSDGNHPGKRP